MRLLLDTHVMLWWLLGDERLPMSARDLIDADSSECSVSMASIWEVAIKSSLGRGLPHGVTAERYTNLIDEAGFTTLAIRVAHVVDVEKLDHAHGDPFNRLMVAQARAEAMLFITHDNALAAYGEFVKLV